MDETKIVTTLTLTALDGTQHQFKYKTQVSEWDSEQIDEILYPAISFDPETRKSTVDASLMGSLSKQRNHKMLELFLVDVDGKAITDYNQLKKEYSPLEYTKLLNAITDMFKKQVPDTKKNEALSNNLSTPSNTVAPSPVNSITPKLQ